MPYPERCRWRVLNLPVYIIMYLFCYILFEPLINRIMRWTQMRIQAKSKRSLNPYISAIPMLRFFRHVRKQLMEKNKIRTYLLYAVGEIFLVMMRNNCPVRDYPSVELKMQTTTSCAVRSKIPIYSGYNSTHNGEHLHPNPRSNRICCSKPTKLNW